MLTPRSARFAAIAGLAFLAACSPQPAAEASPAAQDATPATHSESGLTVVPLTVSGKDGKKHQFRVEVADTPAAQEKGLMFRTELGPNEGMIFPNSPPQMRSFWMKNTVIPLDLVFIGPDRRILNVEHGVPYSLDPIPSAGPAINVLEIADGRAAELGIGPGDLVEW